MGTLSRPIEAKFKQLRISMTEVVMKLSNKDKFMREVEVVQNIYDGMRAMAQVEIQKEDAGEPRNFRWQMTYTDQDTEEINGALDWKLQ